MLTTGTEVGGYRIEGVLGRGGMGVVYEAIQLSLSRTIALKVLASDLSHDDAFRERFRREARTQAIIEHAHIVPVYEAGEIHEGLYIAMRLIRGSNLKQLIHAGDLDAERALKILLAIGDALDSAHESELIHRDIKPQNILVGRRDHAFLADFGLTKGKSDTGYTKTGQLDGDARLRRARAGQGPARNVGERHLRAHRRGVRVPGGPAAVLAADRARDALRARIGSASAAVAGEAGTSARDRRCDRRRAGEEPGRAAGHRRRDADRARGGTARDAGARDRRDGHADIGGSGARRAASPGAARTDRREPGHRDRGADGDPDPRGPPARVVPGEGRRGGRRDGARGAPAGARGAPPRGRRARGTRGRGAGAP